ncbi:hypothetical protein PIB30_080647, partial [Stylosanthes scabra]|nr:hypothetical protein [Stylosanthes scabra]
EVRQTWARVKHRELGETHGARAWPRVCLSHVWTAFEGRVGVERASFYVTRRKGGMARQEGECWEGREGLER